MRDIVIIGAGRAAVHILATLEKTGSFNVRLFDNDPHRWGAVISSFVVEKPERVDKPVFWCITIANEAARNEVRRQCLDEFGLRSEMEIDRCLVDYEIYKQLYSTERRVIIHDQQRIMFACYNGLGMGGVEAWTLSVFKGLSDRGFDNLGILCDDGDYDTPYYTKGRIERVKRDRSSFLSANNYYSIREIILRSLPIVLVTSQIDDVFLTACSLKSHLPNAIKIVSVIHNYKEDDFLYDRYIDQVDLFIGVSEEICLKMEKSGVSADSLAHMTCPFRCEEILKRDYSTDPEVPLKIGYSGRLDGFERSQKRMDLLLDVCSMLKERKIKYRLEIVGDGPAKNEMQDIVKSKGLEKEVIFSGWIDRESIPDFWKSQDIAVSVSDFEGRSISKLEAMANGAIPVLTDTSGVREDVIDKENGIIVPVGDPQGIVDGIEYLYYHRELLPVMGFRAHDVVFPKSSMSSHIDFWSGILKRYEK